MELVLTEGQYRTEIMELIATARASRPAAGAAVAAASPTCELLSVSGPEAITASTETFTAHIFSRARVATTSPSLRKPRARLPHSVNVSKRTFTPFGLLRLQNPQQRPPNGASSNEQPSEPARIVDVERQKYLTPNTPKFSPAVFPVVPGIWRWVEVSAFVREAVRRS